MMCDTLILVSYVELNTNSICYQNIFNISKFSSSHVFCDIQNGYEIELGVKEIGDGLEFLTKDNFCNFDISSIIIRRVSPLYKKKYMPSGAELFHMVYMGKGLSAFSMREDDDEEMILGEQKFSKFVESGVIQKRVVLIPSDGYITKYIIYYLVDQAWRADIYESLKRHLAKSSWTEHLEHIEAIILGYVGVES